METLVGLRKKLESVTEFQSVVKTMKAMAASRMTQFERAATALHAYYNTVELGILAYLQHENILSEKEEKTESEKEKTVGAIVFGSDLGLVRQFNEVLANYADLSLKAYAGNIKISVVGKLMDDKLQELGHQPATCYDMPVAVGNITDFVRKLLIDVEELIENEGIGDLYIFYNLQKKEGEFEPVCLHLFPLSDEWRNNASKRTWPTKKIPQVVGDRNTILRSLIREYVFVSIFRTCVLSLISENACRFMAMQNAKKNIDEMLEDLLNYYHQIRQNTIDEEMFDIVAGFEALKKDKSKQH